MKKVQRKVEQEIHLNMTPMMDLFVGLIPFLIISSAWVSFGGVDVKAPTATASQETQKPEANKTNEVWLEIDLSGDVVAVKGYSKNFDQPVSGFDAKFSLEKDFEKFTTFISELKNRENIKMGPALFHASSETRYEQAIQTLSVLRAQKLIPDIVLAAGVVQ